MSDQYFNATIKGIEPVAQHADRVYDQSIRVRFEDANSLSVKEITVFDDVPRVTEDIVGASVEILISVLPTGDYETLDEAVYDVAESPDPSSEWSYEFTGKVLPIKKGEVPSSIPDDSMFLLDMGIGEVVIQPSSELKIAADRGCLETGSYLRVEGSRTDLLDLR